MASLLLLLEAFDGDGDGESNTSVNKNPITSSVPCFTYQSSGRLKTIMAANFANGWEFLLSLYLLLWYRCCRAIPPVLLFWSDGSSSFTTKNKSKVTMMSQQQIFSAGVTQFWAPLFDHYMIIFYCTCNIILSFQE
jgi:hypothetical protein